MISTDREVLTITRRIPTGCQEHDLPQKSDPCLP